MSDTICKKTWDMPIELSRDEILKKFDLPERKTKINTILKLREEQEQTVYCLCQSTDISKFMIGCEKCDEWYHGDCIGLEEKDAKLIKKWYCFDCIEKHGLKVVYFPHNDKKSSNKRKKDKKRIKRDKYSYIRSGINCGKCSNCLQNEVCGNKDYAMLSERPFNHNNYKNEENHTATNYASKIQSWELHKEGKRIKTEKKRDESEKRSFAVLEPKKCCVPRCTKISRVNSKYCSDECGIAFAKMRILSILPHRVAEHQEDQSVAHHLDMSKLDEIRMQKRDAFEELQELDVKERKLFDLIERAKKMPIAEVPEEMEDDSKLCCVTCGWEVPSRSIIRHMESCFRKFEAQTEVEGLTKANTDNCHIFCDHYNASKKTFCMRLRYVCPDHYKPRKAADNEVCGCPAIKPLSSTIFSGAEKFCQRPKKACNQHYNWEILAMSDIDLERQREWNKLGLLIQEEASIVKQMSNRLGALGFLLHSTQSY